MPARDSLGKGKARRRLVTVAAVVTHCSVCADSRVQKGGEAVDASEAKTEFQWKSRRRAMITV